MTALQNILLVGVGGFAGSVARYLTYQLIDRRLDSLYPWSTFIVNISGSFILGVIFGLLMNHSISSASVRLLLVTGFCGSFTTFSTFAYENVFLLQGKALPTAIIYTAASLGLGFSAVFAGYYLAKGH